VLYHTTAEGFTTVSLAIEPNDFAVDSGEAKPIKSVTSASRRFRCEGEGNGGAYRSTAGRQKDGCP
jgi:hypothetical protein